MEQDRGDAVVLADEDEVSAGGNGMRIRIRMCLYLIEPSTILPELAGEDIPVGVDWVAGRVAEEAEIGSIRVKAEDKNRGKICSIWSMEIN